MPLAQACSSSHREVRKPEERTLGKYQCHRVGVHDMEDILEGKRRSCTCLAFLRLSLFSVEFCMFFYWGGGVTPALRNPGGSRGHGGMPGMEPG